MESSFCVGNKVRIIILEDEDKTGIIVAKSDIPSSREYNLDSGKMTEAESQICWWKVKLDEIGEEKDFPDDRLVKIE
jgi:hypothetical protein